MRGKKKSLIIAIIISIFAIAGIIFIALFRPTKIEGPEIETETDPRSFEEIFWDSETVDEAIETFQKKIDATENPEVKANLYTERSKFLFELTFDDENIFKDQILSDLLEADSLVKSPDSAYILYDRYSFFNDKEKSEYYLKLYTNRNEKESEIK